MSPELMREARNIVVRVRAGDQVAMGNLCQVRDLAKAGNPKAKESLDAINAYIKKHPQTDIGVEPPHHATASNPRAVDALWRARNWPEQQFGSMLAQAAPHVTLWHLIVAIVHGPPLTAEGPLVQAGRLADSKIGRCVRVAVLMKRLQDPSVPISKYCKVSGWELGEVMP